MLFFLLAAAARSPAEIVLLEEGFGTPTAGTYCDPAFPAGWSRADVDGLTPNPSVAYVDDAWVTLDDPFETGNCAAVSTSWYSPIGTANDWLITPLVHLPFGASLSWRAFAYLPPDDADSYEVRFSTGGSAPTDFLSNPTLDFVEAEETTWQDHEIALDDFGLGGRAVRFAFRNQSEDDYLLYLDDVRVAIDTAVLREEFGGVDPQGDCDPLLPEGWLTIDVDQRNPSDETAFVTSAWVASDEDWFTQSSPECVAISTSDYQPTGVADDWMISSPIDLPANAELSWFALSDDPGFLESYEVRYSTGGTSPADFTANAALASIAGESASWTQRAVDLDALGLGGQSIRIAFRNVSNNQFLLLVDSIEIAVPLLFADGFEAGVVGAWSAAAGAP